MRFCENEPQQQGNSSLAQTLGAGYRNSQIQSKKKIKSSGNQLHYLLESLSKPFPKNRFQSQKALSSSYTRFLHLRMVW